METKTAVILCGGLGTRLGSLGKKIPKTLVKVHGKPIIWYIVKFLQQQSFSHFILPLGHKGEKIKKYFKNNKEFNNDKISIEFINTGQNSSIAQRIFKIKKYIKSKNFALLNGDAIFNFNIKNYFDMHENTKNLITFLGCAAKLNYGIVGVFKGKVNSFERGSTFDQISYSKKKNYVGQVYSGISIINKDLLKLKFKKYKNFEKEFYPRVIKKFKTGFNQIRGFWHSIDFTKDIEELYRPYNMRKYNEVIKLKKLLIKKR